MKLSATSNLSLKIKLLQTSWAPFQARSHSGLADNVDHNQMTIDGKGSRHVMGVVSAATSHNSIDLKELKSVQRQKQKKASEAMWYRHSYLYWLYCTSRVRTVESDIFSTYLCICKQNSFFRWMSTLIYCGTVLIFSIKYRELIGQAICQPSQQVNIQEKQLIFNHFRP